MKLSFHGADQNVTGSCHLLQCAGKNILIDCGLFPVAAPLAEDNQQEFGFTQHHRFRAIDARASRSLWPPSIALSARISR